MAHLDDLISSYAFNKTELDGYKKICDKENAQIKQIMLDSKLSEYLTDTYKVMCIVSKRESMNEETLLNIAHTYGIPEIVKTKEYIDFDALEKAIYDGKISEEIVLEMDKAKEVKEVVTLKLSKIKKKEK